MADHMSFLSLANLPFSLPLPENLNIENGEYKDTQ